MYGYFTNGTYDFIEKLKTKSNTTPFLLMHTDDSALAYYEAPQQTLFQESRDYDIIASIGNLHEEGVASLYYTPVTEEGTPIFELDYKQRIKDLTDEAGFLGARVLKPMATGNYILFTLWSDEETYKMWRVQEDAFFPAQGKEDYIVKPPYEKTYIVGEKEEEEE